MTGTTNPHRKLPFLERMKARPMCHEDVFLCEACEVTAGNGVGTPIRASGNFYTCLHLTGQDVLDYWYGDDKR